jgi:hypothetical protein
MKYFNIAIFTFFAAVMIYTYQAAEAAHPVFLDQPMKESSKTAATLPPGN